MKYIDTKSKTQASIMIIRKRLNIDNGLQGPMKEHRAVTSCIKHLVDNLYSDGIHLTVASNEVM